MKIPIFVSCPTSLSKKQIEKREIIVNMLDQLKLEPRALGKSEYPKDYPLKEVYIIAKNCAGGIILGFEQIWVQTGIIKRNIAKRQKVVTQPFPLPTPWNNIEAGILFGLKLPLLIFKENGIEGGVFDNGITDVFIHPMPNAKTNMEELHEVLLKWRSEVEARYRQY